MITRMHHFGMMVDNLDEGIETYTLLGFTLFKQFTKPKMKAAMLFKDDAGIELFEFENPAGAMEQMIKKHSAFVSDNLENDVKRYLERGYELVIPIGAGTAVKRFAYVKDSTDNYIELLEPLDNQVLNLNNSVATGHHNYDRYVGTWVDDPGFDESMQDMRVVDLRDWQ
jgi:catechol 2,3-dioxygenase-like lactoylglutathione lyase family enzyme